MLLRTTASRTARADPCCLFSCRRRLCPYNLSMQRHNPAAPAGRPAPGAAPPAAGHTIGRLAGVAGVPVSTVRYYERAGLLRPEARTGGNYRFYGPASLARLRFIRAAQATGFGLKDIQELDRKSVV